MQIAGRTVARTAARSSASSSIASAILPGARDRLAARQQAARHQASAARQALGQPFKYAEDLDAAAARCAAIAQQMAARQRDVASDTSPVATAQNSNAHEAEAEEIRRLITGPMAAHAPLAPPARAPSTRDTSRPPARAPTPPPRAPERRSR